MAANTSPLSSQSPPTVWSLALVWLTTALATALITAGGCSRKYYRTQADQDVAAIYAEKRSEEAYTLPPVDGIAVDPRSRFFDPSPEDCPALPVPEPRLFGYQLPDLETGDPSQPMAPPEVDSQSPIELIAPEEPSLELPEPLPEPFLEPQSDALSEPQSDAQSDALSEPLSDALPDSYPAPAFSSEVRFAQLIKSDDDVLFAADSNLDAASDDDDDDTENSQGLRIVPIPPEYWQQLPETCVPRMLEFDSVQKEFRRSFEDATAHPVAGLLSDAPRLTLPMITELASLNNRAIQSQKERLYRAALVLSAQRYEYLLRPGRRGNGIGADYTHVRIDSVSQSGLSVPTGVTVRKTTAMAGQFLTSFANDVIFTFNGSSGFAATIGSELVFDFQQTLFQRDVVFEDLTRAERQVVYEMRNLIRAQRSLFVDLANDYYQLLLTYRAIEISSQDYFSNLRAFLQGKAEYLEAGRIPRVQVDQFEQNALGSRSDLVAGCNSLESSLDRLKLLIGLPPELPLNLNLMELESLTASDELTVTRQLVMRTRQTLIDASQSGLRDRDAAVNGATVLINRLTETLKVRRKIEGRTETNEAELKSVQLGRRLQLLGARLKCDQLNQVRNRELASEIPPAAYKQFARTVELIDARLLQARRALELREQDDRRFSGLTDSEIGDYALQVDALYRDWELARIEEDFESFQSIVKNAKSLLTETNKLADRFIGDLLPQRDSELEDVILETVAETVELVDRVEETEVGGLDDVTVQENESMLLALYQRLDLMNERGALADDRRQIKLAADDLRAILDIGATQRLRTNRNINDPFAPFDFSSDRSTTRLSLALDTPLNRRVERNTYRAALIDYQAGRRSLIEREDGIKFDVREDLRQLRLRRNQYEIAVARAALAYERVVSTRLQLQLAVGNVVARDFLEAQQAYTEALNSVAREHISFIRGRIKLFFDTESIRLDQNGYWSGGQDDSLDLPPLPDFYDANPNPYGRLPDCLRYSDEVRQNH